MKKLSPVEFQIMKQVWSLGHCSVRQVQSGLQTERPLAYTTVMTLMDRLHRKGVLRREQNGKAFRYWAGVTREQVLSEAIEDLCAVFFDGSRAALKNYLGAGPTTSPKPPPKAKEQAEEAADIDVELL